MARAFLADDAMLVGGRRSSRTHGRFVLIASCSALSRVKEIDVGSMYCPNPDCSHAQATGEPALYRSGISECADCGSALVDAAPVWPRDDVEYEEFVPVLTLEGAAMVSFVQSLLQSAGIRFFIKNERTQDLFGIGRFGTGFSPIIGAPIVFVEPTKAREAKELLAAIEEDNEGDA